MAVQLAVGYFKGVSMKACSICGNTRATILYRGISGDSWCERHSTLTPCASCGYPTTLSFNGRPRCNSCADMAIDRPDQVIPATARVGAGFVKRGTPVTVPVEVVLQSHAWLVANGLFNGSPHQLGVTRTRQSGGRVIGAATIGVLAGLPEAEFRATVAHESGHVMLAETGAGNRLPDVVAEGFCQVLAHLHLVLDDSSAEAMAVAGSMLRSPDPVYGEGLRLVLSASSVHGIKAVHDALRRGDPRAVGLPG